LQLNGTTVGQEIVALDILGGDAKKKPSLVVVLSGWGVVGRCPELEGPALTRKRCPVAVEIVRLKSGRWRNSAGKFENNAPDKKLEIVNGKGFYRAEGHPWKETEAGLFFASGGTRKM